MLKKIIIKLKTIKLIHNNRGSLLLFVMIFGAVAFTIIITGVASYAIFESKASNRKQERDEAFQIAEAGINYYRWHLAHNPTDYWDGTAEEPGPYLHEYNDKDGNLIGYFSLEIDEPLPGSSVATIRSTGYTIVEPNAVRIIQVRVGFPALTDYAFLSHAGMNFSFTTVVHGKVHSNGEIRFDGESDSWVDSHIRVYGGGHPKSFWRYPVSQIDFSAVSSDLDNIKDAADDGGLHLTSSGKEGWHMVFNGASFALYKVKTLDCYHGDGRWRRRWGDWYWEGDSYCYDIGTETFVQNYNIPSNGAIFVEDNLWVEGTVDGRVGIGVGRFPVQSPYKKIIINDNLTYASHSSDDVVGLLAQGEIIVPYEVPTNMLIDAAIFSQFSKIYRPYYIDDIKNSLTIFGSQISYDGGGWKYVNGYGHVISGFENTNHSYDGNLNYYPPPGFPVGSVYELISWEEL
ncbi:MAG: hypothetical protein WA057_03815 [Candidatus Magasanikiibacteriota bacterium]